MDNVFTVNAAYVTAIAAILAPTITALIHSIKEFQIAKMNSTVSTRLELCEKFSDAYSKPIWFRKNRICSHFLQKHQ